MDEQKVQTRHVLLGEYKKKHNAIETAKISRVYGQGVITDHLVQNWLSKFCSGDTSLKDKARGERSLDLDEDSQRELVGCNSHTSTLKLSLDPNTPKSTIHMHLKKIRNVIKLGVWVSQTPSQKNNEDHISIAITSFHGRQMIRFSRMSLQMIKNGFFIMMLSVKESGLTWMKLCREKSHAEGIVRSLVFKSFFLRF